MGLNASRVWLDREPVAFGNSPPENCLALDMAPGSQTYALTSARSHGESAELVPAEQECRRSTYRHMQVERTGRNRPTLLPS